MKRYLIIGKSPQMCDVFLKDTQGAFRQHKFVLGKKMEVTEQQMTFHVLRQQGYGLIQVVELAPIEEPQPLLIELDEPAKEPKEEAFAVEAPAVHIEETESEEAVAPVRKKRRRKKSQT